ncbi:MAG: hypothetical protein PHY44_04620 [Lachnospiraceae bacterium]|nr:hypothetical protein [Lachnospiraceae bacterium]
MNSTPKCPLETAVMFLNNKEKIMAIGWLTEKNMAKENLHYYLGNISEKRFKEIISEILDEKIAILKGNEYKITEFGRSFGGIIESMKIWGETQKA